MSDFKRELRYEVIKLKTGKLVECLVIESDWPEYEPVWQMIQDRMEGKPNELDRLRAEYASLQESVTAKDLLIASLKKFKEDVVKVFKDHGREFPGTIEHFDTDGITLRKDELTTYATLMFLFDEVASLKEQNAQLQQSFTDALLQVEELEE